MNDPNEAAQLDGRRERSRSSRAKIVAAMLELVEAGILAPSAAQVAERAGVGLRTVFRHFDDMDSLYGEMAETVETRVLPILLKTFESDDWRGRVREMVGRRSQVFETILPLRMSGSLKRFQSAFLMGNYRRLLRLEASFLEANLPDAIAKDPVRFHALQVPLGFQTWRTLRYDQELSFEQARAVVDELVEAVLARIADDIP